jgi:hypothetical protein
MGLLLKGFKDFFETTHTMGEGFTAKSEVVLIVRNRRQVVSRANEPVHVAD